MYDDKFLKRFWSSVKKLESGCWRRGRSQREEYSRIEYKGTSHLSHRVSYVIHYGPIPDGLWVLHKCDNKYCINPEHLFLGTREDNAKDREAKGRGAHNPKKWRPRILFENGKVKKYV